MSCFSSKKIALAHTPRRYFTRILPVVLPPCKNQCERTAQVMIISLELQSGLIGVGQAKQLHEQTSEPSIAPALLSASNTQAQTETPSIVQANHTTFGSSENSIANRCMVIQIVHRFCGTGMLLEVAFEQIPVLTSPYSY